MLKTAMVYSFVFVLAGWGLTGCSQPKGKEPAASETTKQTGHEGKSRMNEAAAGRDTGRQLLGGWTDAEVTPDVEAALDFVLRQMNTSARLEKILSVKTQVVAGRNYDIDFKLDNGEVWNTRVYRNLSGDYSITKRATRIDPGASR